MTQRPRVAVVGGSNMDMVVRAPCLPRPGETVLGGAFAMAPGGKGANQAVAAARLGAQVLFVSRVGNDLFGDNMMAGFEAEGIDTRFVVRDPNAPSGVALIGVEETTGENSILVAPGANANLSVADIENAAEAIKGADVVVCQLETPMETAAAALKIAHAAGVTTILNPAPARILPSEILRYVSVLTPNEVEMRALTEPFPAKMLGAAQALRAQGVASIVVTIGAKGALLVTDEVMLQRVPGYTVNAVRDTTAAGDCFTGALAVALAEGNSLYDAAAFANAAAALSVTQAGAQPSLPARVDVQSFLQSR